MIVLNAPLRGIVTACGICGKARMESIIRREKGLRSSVVFPSRCGWDKMIVFANSFYSFRIEEHFDSPFFFKIKAFWEK
jgi:hypothetical protein